MPQICDMGQTALLPLRRKARCGFFAQKIRLLRPGSNRLSWVPEASMLTTRPPKPLKCFVVGFVTVGAHPPPPDICDWLDCRRRGAAAPLLSSDYYPFQKRILFVPHCIMCRKFIVKLPVHLGRFLFELCRRTWL
jgi:hypothetical protein